MQTPVPNMHLRWLWWAAKGSNLCVYFLHIQTLPESILSNSIVYSSIKWKWTCCAGEIWLMNPVLTDDDSSPSLNTCKITYIQKSSKIWHKECKEIKDFLLQLSLNVLVRKVNFYIYVSIFFNYECKTFNVHNLIQEVIYSLELKRPKKTGT